MYKIGEIRKGYEIGLKRHYTLHIWQACEICGKERWVYLLKGRAKYFRCHPCANKARLKGKVGAASMFWKGGFHKTAMGYIRTIVRPDDFFRPMANSQGYAFEHRLVMAKHLGRCLQKWEKIHHKNGIKDDNRIENLQLVLIGIHNGKVKCPYCRREFSIR